MEFGELRSESCVGSNQIRWWGGGVGNNKTETFYGKFGREKTGRETELVLDVELASLSWTFRQKFYCFCLNGGKKEFI